MLHTAMLFVMSCHNASSMHPATADSVHEVQSMAAVEAWKGFCS